MPQFSTLSSRLASRRAIFTIAGTVFPTMLLAMAPIRVSEPACPRDFLAATPIEERVLDQFERSIEDHVQLHRRVEQSLPFGRMFDDAEEMFAAREALRRSLVEARSGARQGDIFTPSVSQLLRKRLARAIEWHQYDPADILADNRAERTPGTPMPQVNATFPWGLGAAMWPTLLRVLPELSEEVEYRFVDRDLVLIDMHANLVLDILEGALPPGDGED